MLRPGCGGLTPRETKSEIAGMNEPEAPAGVFDLTIRSESATDWEAIARVNELAFARPNEARLVEGLRRSPHFIPELSLVAALGDNVVGHILFTRVTVGRDENARAAISLAPMAVLPGHQRRGIGSALVRTGLEEARRLDHDVVIVVGHVDFYPRFGFVPASRAGIKAPFRVHDEAFMVCELRPGALEGMAGEVAYPPEFSKV